MEKKNNTSVTIAKIVVLLLCAVNVVCRVIAFAGNKNISVLFGVVLNCITIYYMFVAYKKPHGNLLRYLLILVAIESILAFWFTSTFNPKVMNIYDLFPLFEIAIVAYLSGRLNKYKEDIVLFIIALLLSLTMGIVTTNIFNPTNVLQIFVPFEKFTTLLALFVSYVARYKEHTEAGLADK